MNYHHPCPLGKEDKKKEDNPPPLGNENKTKWVTMKPVPGALTINTGNMAIIWSNGKYQAPLH
eukprot:3370643-Ditylum_brightwellii.AAC.1